MNEYKSTWCGTSDAGGERSEGDRGTIDTEWQGRALLSSEPDVGAETQPPGGARPVTWSSGGAALQQRNRGRGAQTCVACVSGKRA